MSINLNKILNNIIVILLAFFVYRKLGGQMPIPATFALLVAVLIKLFPLKGKDINLTKLDVIYFSLPFVLLFGCIYTDNVSYGLAKASTVFIIIASFLIIRSTIYKYFFNFSIYIILFSTLYVLELYFTYGSFFELLANADHRFRLGWDEEGNSGSASPISIPRFICISLIAFFFICNYKKKVFITYFYLTVPYVMFAILILFLSGTKSPLFAIFISFFTIYFYDFKWKYLTVITLTAASVFVSYFFISFQPGVFKSDFFEYRFLNMGLAIEDRLFQANRALSDFDAYIFLFGDGTGNFSYAKTGQLIRDYPHNIIVELLFENGILAVLLFLTFVAFAVYRGVSTLFFETRVISILCVFFFVTACFSGDLISNSLLFGFITLLFYVRSHNENFIHNS